MSQTLEQMNNALSFFFIPGNTMDFRQNTLQAEIPVVPQVDTLVAPMVEVNSTRLSMDESQDWWQVV